MKRMRILIITDAWRPQTNGVVRTYEHLQEELEKLGHTVKVIGPHDFRFRLPMPGYREIELALFPGFQLKKMIETFKPETIHIGTEGPLGQAAAYYCHRRGLPFTTCYHTQFPDYAAKRAAKIFPWLEDPVRRFFIHRLRRFHNHSAAIMTATPSLDRTLRAWGFTASLHRLTRGVSIDLFMPEKKDVFANPEKPVALYVGRIAIEKNLEDFLSMTWKGSKILVGDGPDREKLAGRFPDAVFTGKKTGEDLAACYQSADIFVFPSRTDTFGMVLIEALSCGLPIAAYPVTGPADIVTEPMLGALNDDLAAAAQKALTAPGDGKARHDYVSTHYTWPIVAEQFIAGTEDSGAILQSTRA